MLSDRRLNRNWISSNKTSLVFVWCAPRRTVGRVGCEPNLCALLTNADTFNVTEPKHDTLALHRQTRWWCRSVARAIIRALPLLLLSICHTLNGTALLLLLLPFGVCFLDAILTRQSVILLWCSARTNSEAFGGNSRSSSVYRQYSAWSRIYIYI